VESEPIDFRAEGLLDGVPESNVAQRTELLRWLVGEGFSLGELRWAHERGVLLFLGPGREIAGARLFTPEQLAEQSGIDLNLLHRMHKAQGLPIPAPGEQAYSQLDIDVASDIRGWLDAGFDPEMMLGTTREIGAGLARAAEAMRSFVFNIVGAAGATELEVASTYAAMTAALMPQTDRLIVGTTRLHLRNVLQAEIAAAQSFIAGQPGAIEMAVAFADLVGFTRIGEQLPAAELSRVSEQLVEMVEDLVEPPVRMVKTIGDAVMLAADDARPLVDFGLRLCAYVAEHEDAPQLRVGVAYGEVAMRAGDIIGGPVNVASRVTTVARSGSVLATSPVRQAALEHFAWSPAGVRRLKGLPTPVPLFRARRLPAS